MYIEYIWCCSYEDEKTGESFETTYGVSVEEVWPPVVEEGVKQELYLRRDLCCDEGIIESSGEAYEGDTRFCCGNKIPDMYMREFIFASSLY